MQAHHHLKQENIKAAAPHETEEKALQPMPDEPRLQWRPIHDPGAKRSTLLREIRREVRRALG